MLHKTEVQTEKRLSNEYLDFFVKNKDEMRLSTRWQLDSIYFFTRKKEKKNSLPF